MVLSCSIQSCTNNGGKNKDLSFHRFPKDERLSKIWVQKCKRLDNINLQSARICSAHFVETDFERDLKSELLNIPSKPALKTGAVPSVNLPKETPASSSAVQRKERMQLKRKKTEHDEMIRSLSSSSAPNSEVDIPSENNDLIIPSPPAPEPNENQLQIKYEELLANYETLQQALHDSKTTVRQLRQAMNKLAKKVQKLTKQVEKGELESRKLKKLTMTQAKELRKLKTADKKNDDFITGAKKIFTENQIKLISGTQSRVRWSSDEISQGFAIRYCGKKGYIFLRNVLHYPLPGLSTLQRWGQSIDLKNSFLDGIIAVMAQIGATMDPFDRMTVLLFDEMKVKECYEYDLKHDEVVGPNKQMQTIMARGLTSKWKQVIYTDYDKKMTKEILFTAVMLLHKIGFNVVACVSDLGGGNISLMNELGVDMDHPTFHCPEYDKPIVYFPDAPHLLKLLRNWLIDYGFCHNNEEISIDPICELIAISDRSEVRAAHRLTTDHVPKKGTFARQNVRKAAQLLSHTTSKCLKYFKNVKTYLQDHRCESTANFIELVDKWFDLVNVRFVDRGQYTPPQRKPYGMDLENQNIILDEMAKTMREMKIANFRALQIFQKGIIHHTNAMKALYKNLHPEGLSYFLSNKVNQDALENFFAQERIHSGSSNSPTPLQSKQNARLIFLGKNPGAIVKQKNALEENDEKSEEFILARGLAASRLDSEEPVPDEVEEENVDDDLPVIEGVENDDNKADEPANNPVPEAQNELQSSSNQNTTTTATSSDTNEQSDQNINTITEFNTEEEGHEFLCGWIAMKFHSTHPHLGTPTGKIKKDHQYTTTSLSFVEYLSEGGLYKPTNEFQDVGEKLERVFRDVCGTDFYRGPGIVEKLCYEAEAHLTSEDKKIVPDEVVRRLLHMRVFIRIRHRNQHLKTAKTKQKLKEVEKLLKTTT